MKAFYQDLKLGILGGGQLGRMLIQACTNFNIHTTVMDRDVGALELVEEPLVAVSTRHSHVAGGTDDRPMSPTAEPEIPPPRA
jgi:phosphoribosylaminoimidazole carboxylase (NCAIR synthetase)